MASKNKGGRPALYKTVKQYEKRIEEYIKECEGKPLLDEEGNSITDKYGKPVIISKKPTITGLAYFLGFESKQSLYDYAKKKEFSYSTSRARLYIESSYEEDLRMPGISPAGVVFALKNMDWSDKQEVEHSVSSEAYEKLKELYKK